MPYIAAIDIGSNALRLAIARTTEQGLHHSYRSREAVRLGRSVFAKGEIDDGTLEDLKQALLQFKNQLENFNVLKYRAIATSAMREARNSKEVVEKLFATTGLRIEVISGKEEAQLVSQAISQKIDLSTGSFLLIDIGGGSIELVALIDGQLRKKESFKIGMVRILQLQKKATEALDDWLPAFIENEVSSFFNDLPPLETAVGTGGNMDRFIKLKSFVSDREGFDLTPEEMEGLYKQLSKVDYKQRIKKFSLKPDRADVIIPAAIATNLFLRLGNCARIAFPQVGIKDGVLQELFSELDNSERA